MVRCCVTFGLVDFKDIQFYGSDSLSFPPRAQITHCGISKFVMGFLGGFNTKIQALTVFVPAAGVHFHGGD